MIDGKMPTDNSDPMRTIATFAKFKIHPAANIFPMMSDAEFAAHLADVDEIGLRTVLKFRGTCWDDAELVDGRNRLKALVELGLDYRDHSELIHPEDMPDVLGFVLSLNLHRRHLSESQRAMVAANVANLPNHRPAEDVRAPIGALTESVPIADAARALRVSPQSVTRARKVRAKGTEELQAAVTGGKLSVSSAAEIADLPQEQQAAAIVEAKKPKSQKHKPLGVGIERAHDAINHLKKLKPDERQEAYDIVLAWLDEEQDGKANGVSLSEIIQPCLSRVYDFCREHKQTAPAAVQMLQQAIMNLDPNEEQGAHALNSSTGWTDLKKTTVTTVREYCYRNRAACFQVEKDLKALLKQIKGYRAEANAAKKASKEYASMSEGPERRTQKKTTTKPITPDINEDLRKSLEEKINASPLGLAVAAAAEVSE